MRTINKTASTIFHKMLDMVDDEGYVKINNANGVFMPVSIEKLDTTEFGEIYSVAHYYLQNGDMMADPEVTFLVHDTKGIFPMTYQQHGLFMKDRDTGQIIDLTPQKVYLKIENGQLKCKRQAQYDLVKFCNMWMKNIKYQQDL